MATLFKNMENKLIGNKKFFEKKHMEKFGKEYRDAQLVEKSIYVLEYLAQLRAQGLNPLFRGGSATQLLLPKPFKRLSIDLDIVFKDIKKLTDKMQKIKSKFNNQFFSFSRDRRKGIHFRIEIPTYYTPELSGFIILDVIEKEPKYKTQKLKLKTDFYESSQEVKVPTIDSMIGDKLTTIGINTIGLLKGRPTMEQSKQLYDVDQLMDHMKSFKDVFDAYKECYFDQLEYRKKDYSFSKVVEDMAYTSKLFVVKISDFLNKKMKEDAEYIQDGIIRINNHLTRGARFTRLNARVGGARVMFASRIIELFENKEVSNKDATSVLKDSERIKDLIRDRDFMKFAASEIKKKEKILVPKELIGNAPNALVYVYGYWYPKEFLSKF
ncbi:MAG: nucleotidyl transferase AbiEii/AbiGii toxin family protein [Candidatus Aenigmarchaeota archaeon]|nr:nucleotidyl transferase AbiEii/AbiGii toxin family protein [Candidatus Aenigmarchaeota archaeon]